MKIKPGQHIGLFAGHFGGEVYWAYFEHCPGSFFAAKRTTDLLRCGRSRFSSMRVLR